MNNDLDAKNAFILGLLWRSKTAFRQPDGSYDGLRMRCRSRGVCLFSYLFYELTADAYAVFQCRYADTSISICLRTLLTHLSVRLLLVLDT